MKQLASENLLLRATEAGLVAQEQVSVAVGLCDDAGCSVLSTSTSCSLSRGRETDVVPRPRGPRHRRSLCRDHTAVWIPQVRSFQCRPTSSHRRTRGTTSNHVSHHGHQHSHYRTTTLITEKHVLGWMDKGEHTVLLTKDSSQEHLGWFNWRTAGGKTTSE